MTDDKDVAALSAALTGMFQSLETRPVPEHIQRVIDQLDVAVEAVTPIPSPSSSPEP